jgi:hypothetical protein
MATKTPLEKAIEEFILAQKSRFTFDDLYAALDENLKTKYNEKDVLDILETEGLIFSKDFDSFTPRHVYFKKARFMISPTEREVKTRIIIPGHRFIPFCSYHTPPWKCSLTIKDGPPIKSVVVKEKVRDILVYHTLFGIESLPAYLIEDRAANRKNIGKENLLESVVEISGFDFSTAFERWSFKFGDGFILTVEDWLLGVFSLEYISKAGRKDLMQKSGDWIEKLEKGFLKSFDDLDLDFSLEEQIAYGYFYAGKQVFKSPPIHLGGFIDSSSHIHFVDYGTETRLWRDAHIDPAALQLPEAPEATGATGSIDAIFRDLGISLSEVEVEAYMRDELYHRQEQSEAVLQRIFAGRSTRFYSEAQLGDFVKYFEKLWNRVKRSYNFFADQHTGKLREKILAILDRHLEWLRDLDQYNTNPEDLPVQEMTLSAQTTAFLATYLKMLNKKSVGTESEINETLALLPQIEESLENLRVRIEDHFDTASPPAKLRTTQELRLVKADPAPAPPAKTKGPRKIFVLKVTLQNIKPPIWRRIQIPGSFSLEELHDTIQASMGWDNYHSHSFTIDSKNYGPRMEDSAVFGIEEIDETAVCLDDLDLTERKKMRYTYDFGDNWSHLITVEKISSSRNFPALEKTEAICLAGKRACPPEDCGGLPGYEEIIEALKSPGKKKYRERLNWLGEFDPEFFDLTAANRRLRNEPL